MNNTLKHIFLGFGALIAGLLLWLPFAHFCFNGDYNNYYSETSLAPKAKKLLNRQIKVWTDPESRKEIEAIRRSNPEWDFMWRTHLVFSLSNIALRDPSYKAEALRLMDSIIDDTINHVEKDGYEYFSMAYFSWKKFNEKKPRTMFVDGEISMMLAGRRLVEDSPKYKKKFEEYRAAMLSRMKTDKIFSVESYPDEYWTFDHCVFFASLKIGDYIDKTDYSKYAKQWLDMAKTKLTHPATGMLVSGYTSKGLALHGPEGSTLWLLTTFLRFQDSKMAEEQFLLAKKYLSHTFFSFGYCSEWPKSFKGYMDVDSGGALSLMDMSPSSSGGAIVACGTFKDTSYRKKLFASLKFAGFPYEDKDTIGFSAGNIIGEAVFLYGMVAGADYELINKGAKK